MGTLHTRLRPPPSYRPLPHCLAWASSRRTQAYTGGEGKGPNGGDSSPAWALAGSQRRHLVLSESPRALPPLEGWYRHHYKRVPRPMGALRGSAVPVMRSLVGPRGGPGAWHGGARAAEEPSAADAAWRSQ